MQKYFSGLLLICLAVQVAPWGLIHSHDDHDTANETHLACHEHDHESPAVSALSETAEDFNFEAQEDCSLCEVFYALNDQTNILHKQTTVTISETCLAFATEISGMLGEAHHSNRHGRAPPIV